MVGYILLGIYILHVIAMSGINYASEQFGYDEDVASRYRISDSFTSLFVGLIPLLGIIVWLINWGAKYSGWFCPFTNPYKEFTHPDDFN